MNFSHGEKLILVMLAEIYKSAKIKGEIDPDLVLKAVFNNQAWALGWKYRSVFHSEEKNSAVVEETCQILDMYRTITSSFDKLPQAEKVLVEQGAGHFSDYLNFQGFDHNNDEHSWVVPTLVNDLQKYQEIKNPDLNSHSIATIGHYRRMLAKFKAMPLDQQSYKLTADQLIEILKP